MCDPSCGAPWQSEVNIYFLRGLFRSFFLFFLALGFIITNLFNFYKIDVILIILIMDTV